MGIRKPDISENNKFRGEICIIHVSLRKTFAVWSKIGSTGWKLAGVFLQV